MQLQRLTEKQGGDGSVDFDAESEHDEHGS